MVDEYQREKRFVEEEKPYWLNLTGGTRFSGPLRYELENCFPEAHYRRAIEQLQEEEIDRATVETYSETRDAGSLYLLENEEGVDGFTEYGSEERW